MKLKALIIAIIMGAIILGIFSFMNRQKPKNVIYRLVWFELQVAPASYRFAILPEQPILIGYEGENGEKGATMLIRYEYVPDSIRIRLSTSFRKRCGRKVLRLIRDLEI